MKHRLLIADPGSPLHVEVERLTTERRKASMALRAFLKAEGCSNMRGNSPATYLFDFKSLDDVDPQKWSQVRRRTGLRSWEILFRPRRNTAGGKILSERIKALPKFPAIESAINLVPGLHHQTPMVFTGTHCYSPFIRYYNPKSGLLVVSVPKPEVDAKELQAYSRQAASKKRKTWDANMDAALWAPPAWLREVKEWEALQAIDQDGGEEVAGG